MKPTLTLDDVIPGADAVEPALLLPEFGPGLVAVLLLLPQAAVTLTNASTATAATAGRVQACKFNGNPRA